MVMFRKDPDTEYCIVSNEIFDGIYGVYYEAFYVVFSVVLYIALYAMLCIAYHRALNGWGIINAVYISRFAAGLGSLKLQDPVMRRYECVLPCFLAK